MIGLGGQCIYLEVPCSDLYTQSLSVCRAAGKVSGTLIQSKVPFKPQARWHATRVGTIPDTVCYEITTRRGF